VLHCILFDVCESFSERFCGQRLGLGSNLGLKFLSYSQGQRKVGRPKKVDSGQFKATCAAARKKNIRRIISLSIDSLKTSTGESLTRGAVRMALLAMLQSILDSTEHAGTTFDDLPESTLWQTTTHFLHISSRTAKRLFEAWWEYASPLLDAQGSPNDECMDQLVSRLATQPLTRGPKPLERVQHVTSLHVSIVENLVRERLSKAQQVHARDIRSALQDCEDPVTVSQSTVWRLLRKLGYIYEERKPCRLTESRTMEQRKCIIRFLRESAAASREDNMVLVYMDESYVHHHHATDHSYYPRDIDERIKRPGNRGRRLIIVHAITQIGPLHVDASLTAEWIFQSAGGGGDYHSNMNGDVFMDWVQRKLIPTFEAKFPGKKMALVLDNAPYHHAHDPATHIDIKAMSKTKALEKMLELGMTHMSVIRPPPGSGAAAASEPPSIVTFQLATWGTTRRIDNFPKGPSPEEMRQALKAHVQAHHPGLFDTRIQREFRQRGWKLIFTPPYCPQFQPIELVWAFAKRHVACSYFYKRTMDETAEQLREAFLNPKLNCAGLVAHCEKEMLHWADSSQAFQQHHGSLKSLVMAEEEGVDEPDESTSEVEVDEEGVGDLDDDDDDDGGA
jgi:hypothetical protein